MAAPQGGFPPQEGYGQPAGYAASTSPVQQDTGVPAAGGPAHAGRKKRAYAGEAFGFGSGANAALGGQQPAGGSYGVYPAQVPVAGGYQAQAYGVEPVQTQPAVSGYAPPVSAGVAQMTQQFGTMGVADAQQLPPQPAQAVRPVVLNQLYPTDLLTQPFNAAELDYPPPPIVLPPNVCI